MNLKTKQLVHILMRDGNPREIYMSLVRTVDELLQKRMDIRAFPVGTSQYVYLSDAGIVSSTKKEDTKGEDGLPSLFLGSIPGFKNAAEWEKNLLGGASWKQILARWKPERLSPDMTNKEARNIIESDAVLYHNVVECEAIRYMGQFEGDDRLNPVALVDAWLTENGITPEYVPDEKRSSCYNLQFSFQ